MRLVTFSTNNEARQGALIDESESCKYNEVKSLRILLLSTTRNT
jgi:hypothetical protein